MKFVYETAEHAGHYFLAFLKWLGAAVAVGLVVGLVGTGFHYAVALSTELRLAHDWLIFMLPAGGAAVALLYRLFRVKKDRGTNLVLASVREGGLVPLNMSLLIFVSSALTHLVGGSSGREGAALQLGGSVASAIGRLFRMGDKELNIITMCGMSAAFAALFGTPLTAAVFAIEVVSVGVMHYSAMVPCVVSALIGCSLAGRLGVPGTAFAISGIPSLTVMSALSSTALAILAAVLGILFCFCVQKTSALSNRFFKNNILRTAVGGALVLALTLLFGTRDYNGAGMDIVSLALQGTARPEAFILKLILTAATLGFGFKGGEIVPAMFVGSTFGCLVSPLLGLSPGFGASVALVCLFCAVTNCPLASIILSVELFGAQGLPLYALAAAVSYVMSGTTGLYSEQKIIYSKLRAEYINRKVG